MAYMSQENKKEKLAVLKGIIPKGWSWSLSVRHHSALCLTVWSAPVDLIAEYNRVVTEKTAHRGVMAQHTATDYVGLNTYHLDGQLDQSLELFTRIKDAMMQGNHDRSDVMTDYFDVGWYIDIDIGRWDKPFKVTP